MTYCPPDAPATYDITALTGASLLSVGDHELSCGDLFEMPAGAEACITITDNDRFLSGDACRNERGDDKSGQTAAIEVGGALIHDGAKIYAEEYYVLHGSDGQCYYLVEIEVVGASHSDRDDFYAFYGDVPPGGVTLQVGSKCNVRGDWLDYKCLSAGMKWDFDANGKLTVEAEDMALRGYKIDDLHAASGGEVIKLSKHSGEASLVFGGASGTYDLDLAYVDENDGEGTIEVWVGGTRVHTIDLTANDDGNGNDWSSVSSARIAGLTIEQGDEIVLKGTRDAWEFARIDALTFCIAKDAPPPSEPPEGELCIGFDSFADGSTATAGDTGALVFDGVTFTAIRAQDHDGVLNDAMLFDSSAATATGGDHDLLVGEGNLIIISEDGHSHDPDDNWRGGTIVAEFDSPATVTRIMIVDVEEAGGLITLLGADGTVLGTIPVPVVGDGQTQWVDLGATEGVARMEIGMTGSGAVGAVKFVPGETVPVNAPPVAVADAVTTDEDTAVALALLANDSDPDSDALTVTTAGGVAAGTAFTVQSTGGRTVALTVGADGALSVDPSTDFNGLAAAVTDTISFDYTITDGQGGSASATASVTIEGLNDAPIAANDAYTVGETSTTVLDILTNDTDPDGDALTVTLLTQPVEGAITLNADGTVLFDTNGQFDALSDGQRAEVTFDYRISDGEFTSDATVTVTITGEGVCPEQPLIGQSAVGLLADLTPITVTFDAPEHTCDGTADFRLSVELGDTRTDQYNIVYVVDISRSTGLDTLDGIPVLDAQQAALDTLTANLLAQGIPEENLTISLVPFNGNTLPTEPSDENGLSFTPQTFRASDGTLNEATIDAAIGALEYGGETNYINAILATANTFQSLGANPQTETAGTHNIVYFLSDGVPFPVTTPPAQLEFFRDFYLGGTSIHGVAIGEVIDPSFVDAIDNTGGAALVRDVDENGAQIDSGDLLDRALGESTEAPGTILSATLTIADQDGTTIDSFVFDGSDFAETPLGFELAIDDVAGLGLSVTDTSTATLVVALDGDNDLVADDTVTLAVDIQGLLPESTVL